LIIPKIPIRKSTKMPSRRFQLLPDCQRINFAVFRHSFGYYLLFLLLLFSSKKWRIYSDAVFCRFFSEKFPKIILQVSCCRISESTSSNLRKFKFQTRKFQIIRHKNKDRENSSNHVWDLEVTKKCISIGQSLK